MICHIQNILPYNMLTDLMCWALYLPCTKTEISSLWWISITGCSKNCQWNVDCVCTLVTARHDLSHTECPIEYAHGFVVFNNIITMHWNGNVVSLKTFLSIVALEVVEITMSGAVSDENLIKLTTFLCFGLFTLLNHTYFTSIVTKNYPNGYIHKIDQ